MPLIKGKSKKAFEHNIKTEMEHGKPQDQALAIAYSTQRAARKRKAHGGEVSTHENRKMAEYHQEPSEQRSHKDKPDMFMAEGGEVSEHYESIADAILAKKRRLQANPDHIDLAQNAEEEYNCEDDLSFDALRKENYSESDALHQLDSPDDSNEKIDADERNIMERLRAKIRAKYGLR